MITEYEAAYAEQIRWQKEHPPNAKTVLKVMQARLNPGANGGKLQLNFVGSQDGAVEKEVKAAVSDILKRHAEIERAYLAQVRHGEGTQPSVALCLAASKGKSMEAIKEISHYFTKSFRSGTVMDIIFLSPDQEQVIEKICQPFYTS